MLHTPTDLVHQLRAYRMKVGLTQEDIAWKLGFSPITVSRWERGVSIPDLRATGAIVDFLRRADQQSERLLIRAIQNSRESRNLWEGRDIRYLAGSPQEFRESPEMRAVVGTSIRRYVTGIYREVMENHDIINGIEAGEIARIDIYGGPVLSMTSIPSGFVQLKRLTFGGKMLGIIRGETQSMLIPAVSAPPHPGFKVLSWDVLSRRP
ncbi:helix-turn-helix domain-containing protein [Sinorhizobium sp. BG8]|uniref:helix-turn-helix domain-containing protein n=1 Tax=Sinorhizobium sp. BG8 TaxID=2613773 RepID=UPI00193CFB6A|nr:helix-turn-helix domain-containing protein [Sinorhizobium sp. BG8]QRM54454.1 helix-turn-helix domain-containing protein [Sinorhizobium sp. BG8]